MKRLVNGVEVELSPAEEAAQLAEWAANDAADAVAKANARGAANFKAQKEREAQDLEDAGDTIGAVLLRLKHNLQ